MLIPIYNSFRLVLPQNILPHFLIDLGKDMLRDAGLSKVYNNDPINCILESIAGASFPGMHLNLIEQKSADQTNTGSIARYWPKGMNALRSIDDDEFALTFRHINGFANYHLLYLAIEYVASDQMQQMQGEQYKSLLPFQTIQLLSKNYKLVKTYLGLTYKQIDGNEFKYASGVEENTFTIRFKFSQLKSDLYFKDKLITSLTYNHNRGN